MFTTTNVPAVETHQAQWWKCCNMVSFSLSHTHTHQRLFPKNQTLSYGSLQSNEEISIANRRKLNELQENSRWYINYTSIKKQTIKKRENFNRQFNELKTEGRLYQRYWNSKQIEILELKNSINKMKTAIESIKLQQTIWKRELASLKI